jgi:hypothetical protein
MASTQLHRYWIEFDSDDHGSLRSFGVTALNLDDALLLIREWAGGSQHPGAEPNRVLQDVDVRKLDEGHVRPNMLPPNWRGVWYPARALT